MSAISACLFDYGNTLVPFDREQTDAILCGLAKFLRARGQTADQDRLQADMTEVCRLPYRSKERAMREHPPLVQMALLLERSLDRAFDLDDPLVVAANDELQRLFVASVSVEADVVDFLRQVSARLPIGLVSNYPCGAAIRRSLDATGLRASLPIVVVSGDVGWVKPHHVPFQAALDELSCPPEEVIFVGDRWDADMIGASALGMITCHHVGYTSDRDLRERYEAYRPHHTIEHVRELEGILR